MVDLFERNLNKLLELDPELAANIRIASVPDQALILPALSGRPTLTVKGISLHSRFDPVAEAETLLKSPMITEAREKGLVPVLFGLGLGYQALALAGGFDPVLVIEPDPGMIKLAFSHLDFTQALPRLRFLTAPSAFEHYPPARLVPHPPSVRLHRTAFCLWTEQLEARRSAAELNKFLVDLPGWSELLVGFDPTQPVDLLGLVGAVRRRTGPLSEGETLVLLLHELTMTGR